MIEIVFEQDYIKNRLKLGLCCINTELRKKNIFCSRTCIRKNFTVKKAKELAISNINDIVKLLDYNKKHNIDCFRLSSNIFPHITDSETEHYTIDFAKENLKYVGNIANSYKHRIVMHPGQYNQIASPSMNVFNKTVEDLSHHADILDTMNINDDGVIIVHGGGTYNDKENTKRRWIERFDDLPKKVKNRLTIENCERQYSTRDCLDIAEECKIPVTFDFHHYNCWNVIYSNKQEKIKELLPEVIETWNDKRVLMHLSEQGPGRIGNHSDYINIIPNELLDILKLYPDINIDLEIEAKKKEQAIFRLYKNYPELF